MAMKGLRRTRSSRKFMSFILIFGIMTKKCHCDILISYLIQLLLKSQVTRTLSESGLRIASVLMESTESGSHIKEVLEASK